MPFKRRSSYTLTLAIVAATPLFFNTTDSLAQESPTNSSNKDEMLWDCQMSAGQDWECDLSKELQEQNSQLKAEPTAKKTNEPPSSDTDIKVNTASDAPVVKSEPVIPVSDISSRPKVASSWNCQTGSQGSWDCSAGNKAPVSQNSGNTVPTASTVLSSAVTTSPSYGHLDWYPYTGGTNQSCKGQYVEPEIDFDTDDDSLRIDADQSKTQLGGLTSLQGNVVLRQGGHSLRSNSAELDQVTDLATLSGKVEYREPGLLLISENAQTNITSKETVLTQAEYVIHEASLRGGATRIIRLNDNRIRLEDGSFTTCPPDDASWRIAANTVTLDPNSGFGEATHAVLEVANTPVMYLPYFTFPIDDRRKSGFLYPAIGYSESEGLELAAPYYFNLAPHYDDTLTPHYFSERGLLLENEFRYKTRYGEQALSTGYLAGDKKVDDDRWLLGLSHTGKRRNWSSTVDFTSVSDNQYFDDLGSSLEVNRDSHLDKLAQVTYEQPNWAITTKVHSYQTIDSSTAPYRRLPQVTFSGNQNWLSDNLQFDYLVDAVRFDRDLDGLSGTNLVIGDRFHLQPSISLPLIWPWAHLTPKISYWHTQYELDNQVAGKESSISRGTAAVSIDSGLVFEKAVRYGTTKFTQTLEPRAFLLYVPEEDQSAIPDFDTTETEFSYNSLFRENRFNGLDKIGDSQQLSLGISSAFYEESGYERARLNLGQAFYFDDRIVQLNGVTTVDTSSQSNYAAEATWNVNKDLRVTLDTELENSDFGFEESNLKVSYSPSINQVFNFSYRHREDVRQQTDLSLIWPINQHWNVLGRWQEDFENKQTPEALLGLEYSSCCWKLRVAARQWIEDDTGGVEDSALYLQFILKGLGALGNGGSGAFNEIIGFEEREENNDY